MPVSDPAVQFAAHHLGGRPLPDDLRRLLSLQWNKAGSDVQLSHAFATLLGPHVDTKLARKLHKRWLPPVTTKPKPWEARTD